MLSRKQTISQKSCRTCLTKCENSDKNVTVLTSKWYLELTGYRITSEDIPKKICRKCTDLLENFQIFKIEAAIVEEDLQRFSVTESDHHKQSQTEPLQVNDSHNGFDLEYDKENESFRSISNFVTGKKGNDVDVSTISIKSSDSSLTWDGEVFVESIHVLEDPLSTAPEKLSSISLRPITTEVPEETKAFNNIESPKHQTKRQANKNREITIKAEATKVPNKNENRNLKYQRKQQPNDKKETETVIGAENNYPITKSPEAIEKLNSEMGDAPDTPKINEDHQLKKSYTRTCKYCNFETKTYQILVRHIDSTHADIKEKYFCDLCGTDLIFKTKSLLRRHMKATHLKRTKTKQVPFKCEYCLKEFSSKWNLNDHTSRTHSQVASFVCQFCGEGFPIEEHLISHLARFHDDRFEVDRYICHFCERSFLKKNKLAAHIRTKHLNLQQRRECKLCNFTTTSKDALKYHLQKTHLDEKDWEYSCVYCGRKFADRSNRNAHERAHRKEKNYKCRYCGERFMTNQVLKMHWDAVHNPTEYKCVECDKAFASQAYLKQHMKTHNQQYKCPLCPSPVNLFAYTQSLRQHILSFHPNLPMPPPGTDLKHHDWSYLFRLPVHLKMKK